MVQRGSLSYKIITTIDSKGIDEFIAKQKEAKALQDQLGGPRAARAAQQTAQARKRESEEIEKGTAALRKRREAELRAEKAAFEARGREVQRFTRREQSIADFAERRFDQFANKERQAFARRTRNQETFARREEAARERSLNAERRRFDSIERLADREFNRSLQRSETARNREQRAKEAQIRRDAAAERRADRDRQARLRQNANLGGTVPSLRRVVAAFALFEAARQTGSVIGFLVREAIEFNRQLETSEASIRGLLAQSLDLVDSFGNTPDIAQRLSIAGEIGQEQLANLRNDARTTTASLADLVQTFQANLSLGLRAGLDVDQVRQFTVRISQAATALALPQNQLAEEVRSLLQGTINPRNSRIAVALGITNQQIRAAREQGELFSFLSSELEAFGAIADEQANTLNGRILRLRQTLQEVAGLAGGGFTTNLSNNLGSVLNELVNQDTGELNQGGVNALVPFFNQIDQIRRNFVDFLPVSSLEEAGAALETIGEFLRVGTSVALGFFQGLTDIAGIIISIGELGQDLFGIFGFGVGIQTVTRLVTALVLLNATLSATKLLGLQIGVLWTRLGRIVAFVRTIASASAVLLGPFGLLAGALALGGGALLLSGGGASQQINAIGDAAGDATAQVDGLARSLNGLRRDPVGQGIREILGETGGQGTGLLSRGLLSDDAPQTAVAIGRAFSGLNEAARDLATINARIEELFATDGIQESLTSDGIAGGLGQLLVQALEDRDRLLKALEVLANEVRSQEAANLASSLTGSRDADLNDLRARRRELQETLALFNADGDPEQLARAVSSNRIGRVAFEASQTIAQVNQQIDLLRSLRDFAPEGTQEIFDTRIEQLLEERGITGQLSALERQRLEFAERARQAEQELTLLRQRQSVELQRQQSATEALQLSREASLRLTNAPEELIALELRALNEEQLIDSLALQNQQLAGQIAAKQQLVGVDQALNLAEIEGLRLTQERNAAEAALAATRLAALQRELQLRRGIPGASPEQAVGIGFQLGVNQIPPPEQLFATAGLNIANGLSQSISQGIQQGILNRDVGSAVDSFVLGFGQSLLQALSDAAAQAIVSSLFANNLFSGLSPVGGGIFSLGPLGALPIPGFGGGAEGGIVGFQGGGPVPGGGRGLRRPIPGLDRRDRILAALRPGEFVLRPEAVAGLSPAFLSALNSGGLSRSLAARIAPPGSAGGLAGFADGGSVTPQVAGVGAGNILGNPSSSAPRMPGGREGIGPLVVITEEAARQLRNGRETQDQLELQRLTTRR